MDQYFLAVLKLVVYLCLRLQVMFSSVGGLGRQIRALKEMILFPLMYPEVFEKFKISPPKGVLFHGPPGVLKHRLEGGGGIWFLWGNEISSIIQEEFCFSSLF